MRRARLGLYISEYSERNKMDFPLPVYSVTNSQGFCQQYFNKVIASENRSMYKVVPRGCFAYNPSRINVGSIDWQRNEERVIVSPLYVVFQTSMEMDNQFLYYYLRSDVALTYIKNWGQGSVRDNLKFTQLSQIPINVYPIEEQQLIAQRLDVLSKLISLRQRQAEKLDELVKARFVEMFGDPISNPHAFARVPLSELAVIKIGPFGSLLHKEDYVHGEHALINPSHITNGKIVIDENLTVSDEKYIELEAYQLRPGDVVLGRRGEMGRCAVVEREGYLCGTGSLLIRTNGQVTADYIQKTISFPAYKRMIEDMAVGQTMQNLNVPIVSKFPIVKPPLDVQKRYYHFVHEIDCEKERIQKSAALLETLKRSLMQQYFG